MNHWRPYTYQPEEIGRRIRDAEELSSRRIDDKEFLKTILGCIDLTSLNATDTSQTIHDLCLQALEMKYPVAAVCVYPTFVSQAAGWLRGSNIRLAAVAGSFPGGMSPIHVKVQEVEWTVAQGAEEIDMVISRGTLMEGKQKQVADEVRAIRKACGSAHLKVILETGELAKPSLIRRASEIALDEGAHFIKTSTGKIQPAATPEAALIMCDTLHEFRAATGIHAGFKPAGGISTPEQALLYAAIMEQTLGKDSLNPGLFRIGASRLVKTLLDLIC